MNNNFGGHLKLIDILDFCAFREWDAQTTELAVRVNTHIAKCEKCREKVMKIYTALESEDDECQEIENTVPESEKDAAFEDIYEMFSASPKDSSGIENELFIDLSEKLKKNKVSDIIPSPEKYYDEDDWSFDNGWIDGYYEDETDLDVTAVKRRESDLQTEID